MKSGCIQVLLLATNPHQYRCVERQRVCRWIMRTPDKDMHITILEIKVRFRRQVAACADDGVLVRELWSIIRCIVTRIQGTSQEIEGVNSLVKNACR